MIELIDNIRQATVGEWVRTFVSVLGTVLITVVFAATPELRHPAFTALLLLVWLFMILEVSCLTLLTHARREARNLQGGGGDGDH